MYMVGSSFLRKNRLAEADSMDSNNRNAKATAPSTTTTLGLNPALIKGYRFFDSQTGGPLFIRGIDYNPRPNTGPLNANSVDFYSEARRHIWERDIEYFKELGVNAIRLYAVDPDVNHDAFMCALDAAGIYVFVEVESDCPTCAVTRDEAPDCYPVELKLQGQKVINQFAKYPNTLAFSTGNEVNHFAPIHDPQWNAPCQKKFLRDMREYIRSCPLIRKVPIGLVMADSDRKENAMYYNCRTDPDDEMENAEFYGLNTYVFCNGKATEFEDALGFKLLETSFEGYNYSIPVLLTEFGCLSETFPTIDDYEGQRNFLQARWLQKPSVQEYFAGGFAFEYSIEKELAESESPYPFKQFGKQNYGIGYFSPEDCDDVNVTCKYNPIPSFYNLKAAYNVSDDDVTAHMNKMDEYTIPEGRTGRSECPKQFPKLSDFEWEADHTQDLKCPPADMKFVCPAVGAPSGTEKGHGSGHTFFTTHPFILSLFGLCIAACCSFFVFKVLRHHQRGFRQNMTLPFMFRARRGSDSSEEESSGLLSLPNVESTDYMAVESDSSEDD